MPAEPQGTLRMQDLSNPSVRARSLPYRRPYVAAVGLSALHYLGLLALVTSAAMFLSHPTPLASRVMVGAVVFTGITWLVAFLKRRSVFCPLCKGTPLLDSGARTHSKAKRLPPFNHGTSATLSILATQQFRCMYCGCQFDLLKKPPHKRQQHPMSDGSNSYYEQDKEDR
jgi:hypothetical protein